MRSWDDIDTRLPDVPVEVRIAIGTTLLHMKYDPVIRRYIQEKVCTDD